MDLDVVLQLIWRLEFQMALVEVAGKSADFSLTVNFLYVVLQTDFVLVLFLAAFEGAQELGNSF